MDVVSPRNIFVTIPSSEDDTLIERNPTCLPSTVLQVKSCSLVCSEMPMGSWFLMVVTISHEDNWKVWAKAFPREDRTDNINNNNNNNNAASMAFDFQEIFKMFLVPKWPPSDPQGVSPRHLSDPHWVTKKWGVLKGLGFSLMVSFFVGVPPTQVVTTTHKILSRANVSWKTLDGSGNGTGVFSSLRLFLWAKKNTTWKGRRRESEFSYLM